MSVTKIHPKAALVVIDLQKGIAQGETVHALSEIVANTVALATAFRDKGKRVVWVNVSGTPPGRTESKSAVKFTAESLDLLPELSVHPCDLRVTKKSWGAFSNTNLDSLLKHLDIKQIVLAGMSTSIGVESTARQAYELGYHVTLASDAMTDRVAEAHENSMERIFPRLGEIGSTAEILALMA